MTSDHDPRGEREVREHETEHGAARASVIVRPGVFLTLIIASALVAGAVIYWLLRSMHI